jgi:hypothetical protein
MNLLEIEWDDVNWINMVLARTQWRALVNTVINLSVRLKSGTVFTS